MSSSELVLWLAQSLAVGGGLLFLATCLMALVRQPVRRRMIGAAAVRIALLVPLFALAPKWLLIPVKEAPAAVVGDASEKRQSGRFSAASPTAAAVEQPGGYDLVFVPARTEP